MVLAKYICIQCIMMPLAGTSVCKDPSCDRVIVRSLGGKYSSIRIFATLEISFKALLAQVNTWTCSS